MACLLIDYENESGRMLEGISFLELREDDEIIFFYSLNASRITMELHRELEKIKAKKIYIKTETGTPNSLDFQLSSYLGACIQKYPQKKYYIVSEDHGYDCVCHFWKNKNICITRIDRLCYYADINHNVSE